MPFENRVEAGRLLAKNLRTQNIDNPLIAALPRGGVPIAFEMARELAAPVVCLSVRKIGAPFNPEYGIGAMAEEGILWINQTAKLKTNVTDDYLKQILRTEGEELQRRAKLYRPSGAFPDVKGRNIIVADDGLATGATARAASLFFKMRGAAKIYLAVPACLGDSAQKMIPFYDKVLFLEESKSLNSIGAFYRDFRAVADDEVLETLGRLQISKEMTSS